MTPASRINTLKDFVSYLKANEARPMLERHIVKACIDLGDKSTWAVRSSDVAGSVTRSVPRKGGRRSAHERPLLAY